MSANTVTFRQNGTTDSNRRRSPNVWADCPWNDIEEGATDGIIFYDNFVDLPLPGTLTTEIGLGKYKAFADSGCTITRVSTVNSVEIFGGALQFAMDTNNDAVVLAQAYPSFMLTGLTSNSGKLWFECCYAQNSIATNMASTFFGLAETEQFTLASGVPLNDGDAITNGGSIIGFRIEEDGLGVVDTVYSDRATSFTNIGDTEGGTLAANTFTKFGMVYDPSKSENCVRFYVNGVECTTKLSKSTLTGLTNLDANALGLIWATTADSAGTSFAGWMKWWACAQLAP